MPIKKIHFFFFEWQFFLLKPPQSAEHSTVNKHKFAFSKCDTKKFTVKKLTEEYVFEARNRYIFEYIEFGGWNCGHYLFWLSSFQNCEPAFEFFVTYFDWNYKSESVADFAFSNNNSFESK